MKIEEIVNSQREPQDVINDLQAKSVEIPSWAELNKEYDPKQHPVYTDKSYRGKFKNGVQEQVTRIALGWQKLAVKRMSEMMFGIPVQRTYNAKNEQEERVAAIMESIFQKNRIDALNINRSKQYFAACEVVTLWYTQEQATMYAGEQSRLKLRCKSYSPMDGVSIYPLFDEYDDMIALSVEYTRKENDSDVIYFDCYTANEHIRYRTENNVTEEELREAIVIEKIAGVYLHRNKPIWEDQSDSVYEAEWTYSRNGNFIRKNATPTWVEYTNAKLAAAGKVVRSRNGVEKVEGREPNDAAVGRNRLRYNQGDKAGYVTWQQAIESIKFHVEELKRNFFMQLQLPDMSMDNMKATPMSGEARKIMFIDAQLKVVDESGAWLEFFDREINVVRAFMKKMYPALSSAIDTLEIDVEITPFTIKDEAEKIQRLTSAVGGKQIMSQKTAIRNLGYVENIAEELEEIAKENELNLFDEPTL